MAGNQSESEKCEWCCKIRCLDSLPDKTILQGQGFCFGFRKRNVKIRNIKKLKKTLSVILNM
jgi:hypothetical protein